MTNPIYCYYHRHARLEIIQRHGQTYAVCPECRAVLADRLGEISIYPITEDMLHPTT